MNSFRFTLKHTHAHTLKSGCDHSSSPGKAFVKFDPFRNDIQHEINQPALTDGQRNQANMKKGGNTIKIPDLFLFLFQAPTNLEEQASNTHTSYMTKMTHTPHKER